MAFIVQTFHLPNTKEEDIKKPIIFVDTINVSSYTVEMHNVCLRYIRDNSDDDDGSYRIFKFDQKAFTIKREQDIRSKPDGLYYIADEATNTFVMYRIERSLGFFYDSTKIEKVFSLKCVPGIRICPSVLEKTSDKEKASKTDVDSVKKEPIDFMSELKSRAIQYRDRADKGCINIKRQDGLLTESLINI